MGKRSSFDKMPRDLYPTWDPRAVAALLPHLSAGTRFVEPCAGDGTLIDQLVAAGHVCTYAFDIEPQRGDIHLGDAAIELSAGHGADCFITNPPWTRTILHPIIRNLSARRPTWLLFDADWIHTKQAIPYLHLLRKVVSIGRLRWIEGTSHDGKDNCCWYQFTAAKHGPTQFYGRRAA